MKALVLAGGSGTRLRPFSHSMPKQLIPLANKPILAYVLEDIARMGVTEVAMIVGRWASDIVGAIGDGARFGLRISYIEQDQPLGLAHCVRLAEPFLGADDFVMYLGDNVLPDGAADLAAEFRARRPAAHIVVQKVGDPHRFGIVEVAPNGAVERLVEKPAQPRSDLAVVGVYFFTAAIHRAVASIAPSDRGELEITDAIQWLLANGAAVEASRYEGYWRDIGHTEDVLACNGRLLGALRPDIAGEVDDASSVVGDVVVERGARVVRSRIEGPAIVGAHTLIEDSHVGPNTAIGRACTLSATDLAESIVQDGSSISSVRGLRSSVIGRSAAIKSIDHGSPYHRLAISDHVSVELAG
ncbi:glucose-1-phosphate thymidylyltransferase [Micromonospora sp. PLK6-60]|uniref:glucose-1-phosphate thymidylyltransferase n=1 Tax=Micromonospora sp. PLK6-60 TaxID=2873383 RepID=UPI001CA6B236|nr:glucose-1-phosphate thymidylyltransferase [Micromonospora sp. PLK6-60]MBY8870788.1 glucose-1-phosphate thymidylyltransferase [Micromonospora sp. PLK6-60]